LRLDKSIVVLGKSIESTLHKAANQLHASTEDLAYEILEHGLLDPNGFVKIFFKLRVTPLVSPPPKRKAPQEVYDIPPPFSRGELDVWSPSEFLSRLETAVSNQPGSISTPHLPVLSNEPLELRCNLDKTHPPIDHDGDITVYGNVCRGVKITSAGSISIFGDVDEAHLEAENDIFVDGCLLGVAKTRLGGFETRYAQGAYVECLKSLRILESCYHSTLVSGSDIFVGDAVIGGRCIAPQSISAEVIGSETGVTTKIFTGRNSSVREEAEQVRKQALHIVTRISELTRDIKQYSQKEFAGFSGTVEERMKLWAAMSEKVWLNDRLISLSKRKSILLASIDQDRSAKVTVVERVYPQTQIEIDDVGMTVKKLTQYVTFTKDYEASALKVTSFR
jgi:uncharacterized protein (DUF342 family)